VTSEPWQVPGDGAGESVSIEVDPEEAKQAAADEADEPTPQAEQSSPPEEDESVDTERKVEPPD
jgi:hypothetical protein